MKAMYECLRYLSLLIFITVELRQRDNLPVNDLEIQKMHHNSAF